MDEEKKKKILEQLGMALGVSAADFPKYRPTETHEHTDEEKARFKEPVPASEIARLFGDTTKYTLFASDVAAAINKDRVTLWDMVRAAEDMKILAVQCEEMADHAFKILKRNDAALKVKLGQGEENDGA